MPSLRSGAPMGLGRPSGRQYSWRPSSQYCRRSRLPTRPMVGSSIQKACMPGRTKKPSSAQRMAGSTTAFQGRRPCAWCMACRPLSVAGVPMDCGPMSLTRPLRMKPKPSGVSPSSRSCHMSSRAASGAGEWKSKYSCTRSPGLYTAAVPKPAMPHISGSTTVWASAVATAASTALPPARRMSMPDSAASGWGQTTMASWVMGWSFICCSGPAFAAPGPRPWCRARQSP